MLGREAPWVEFTDTGGHQISLFCAKCEPRRNRLSSAGVCYAENDVPGIKTAFIGKQGSLVERAGGTGGPIAPVDLRAFKLSNEKVDR